MSREHVISISSHMIYNGISIYSHSILPACVDHISQRISSSHSRVQSIACRLIKPEPWVQLSILGVFKVKDRLLGRKNLNSKISSFPDHHTLLRYIIIGPTEHLNNCTFLAFVETAGLIDRRMVPNEIQIIKIEGCF